MPDCASRAGSYNTWYLSTSAGSPLERVNGVLRFKNLVDSTRLGVDDTLKLCYNELKTYGKDSLWVIFGHNFGDAQPGRSAHAWFRVYLSDTCKPAPMFTTNTTNVCLPSGLKVSNQSRGYILNHHWYFEGGSPAYFHGEDPPGISYTTPGRYAVKLVIETVLGNDSITDSISVHPPFVSQPVQHITVQAGDSVRLMACDSGVTYRWSGSGAKDFASPYIKPLSSTAYTCTVTNSNGCAIQCEYKISVHTPARFSIPVKVFCTPAVVKVVNDHPVPGVLFKWYFTGAVPAYYEGATPPLVTYAMPGRYAIKLVAGSDSITDSVVVHQTPSFQQNNQVYTIAFHDSIQLGACAPGAFYVWSIPGVTDSVSGYLKPRLATQQYTCTVTNNGGCSTECRYTVNRRPLAAFGKSATGVCEGSSVHYTDKSELASASNTRWYFEGGTPETYNGSGLFDVMYRSSGRFAIKLVVTNAAGKDSVMDSVDVYPLSSAPQSQLHDTIAYGDSVRLAACRKGKQYLWDPPVSSDSLTGYLHINEVSKQYTCTISNQEGCPAVCSYTIHVLPKALFLHDTVVCGNAAVSYTDQSLLADAGLKRWYFEGGTPQTYTGNNVPDVTYVNSGKFAVRLFVQNVNGTDSITDSVLVNPAPVPKPFVNRYRLQYGDSVQLKAGATGAVYTWEPSFIQGDTVTEFIYPAAGTITATCTVSTPEGCSMICTYTIETGNGRLLIPNAFTPGGDGINDLFEPAGAGIEWYSLDIYNRWGGHITKLDNKGWDGLNSPADVYVWQLSYRLSGNTAVRTTSGTVTLLR